MRGPRNKVTLLGKLVADIRQVTGIREWRTIRLNMTKSGTTDGTAIQSYRSKQGGIGVNKHGETCP